MKYIVICAVMASIIICGCVTVKNDVSDSTTELTTTNTFIMTGNKLEIADVSSKLSASVMPDTSKNLTLEDVVDIALNNNKSTRIAWEYLKISEAQKTQADSYYYPTLDVNAAVKTQYAKANIDAADSDLMQFGPGASLTWLIFDFGGRSGGVNYADRLLEGQLASYNQSIQDVLLDSSTGYFQLNSTIEVLASIEIDITNAVATLNAAQKRMNAKLGTELDVLNARSKLEQVMFQKATAESNLKSAHANLAYILGLPANIKFEVTPVDKPTDDITNLVVNVDDLIEDALEQRSDLQNLKAQKMASEANLSVVSSDLYPSFSLGGDAGYSWYDVDAGLYNGLEDELTYSASVSLNWQVFDGFLNTSKRREAIHMVENAQTVLEQGKLSVSTDVWNSYYQFEAAIKQLNASSAYLANSSRAFELASKSYKNGLISILDLLDAQSDISLARRQEIESRNNLLISLANLAHSTGRLSKDNDLISTINVKENK
ncbi:MAG: TolC family protein [Kiritimatiellae bacterium]|jgi:outer membrane protein|nr:TolC family protein [Kiritimatiellia bacterium]